MITELQIAEENIRVFNGITKIEGSVIEEVCKEHKQSCQRFLGFLGKLDWKGIERFDFALELSDKMQDLKATIKLYEENGI